MHTKRVADLYAVASRAPSGGRTGMMFETVVAGVSRVTEGTGMMLFRSLAPGLLPGGRGGRERMIVSLRSFLACTGSECPGMAPAKLLLGIRAHNLWRRHLVVLESAALIDVYVLCLTCDRTHQAAICLR